MSVNNEEKTTKLVTQWNISVIDYNASGNTAFEESYVEDWLNDTSVDGFLGNLRDPEKFIVMDAKWDATMDARELGSIQRQNVTTVTNAVGLLNTYEYQSSNNGGTDGYLNNGLNWYSLTPFTVNNVRSVGRNGQLYNNAPHSANGVRPSINLKSSVSIVDGNGTIDNPYRLEEDNDINLSGIKLSTRYSGEYIRFGNDENNLYRIVSHENGAGTKITSAEPLKDSGTFITSAFGSNVTFSNTNTIGSFLNGEYLTNYVGSNYGNMIEDGTAWYLGTVERGASYKLAKYTNETDNILTPNTVTAKAGILRTGELMAGQFERYAVKDGSASTGLTITYWTLTPYSSSDVRSVHTYCFANNSGSYSPSSSFGIKPAINLKSNVVITGGNGTKERPFTIELQ